MWVSTLHTAHNVGVHTAHSQERASGIPGAVQSVMHPGVGHDVVNWASVEGDLFAHKQAVRFLRAGFRKLVSTD